MDPPQARCSILEAESIQSLTPLLQQADQWAEVLVLLPLLVALEIVLSADNAIALAAIARGLLPGAWINLVVIDHMDEHGDPLPAVAIVPTPPRLKRTFKTKPQPQPQLHLL